VNKNKRRKKEKKKKTIKKNEIKTSCMSLFEACLPFQLQTVRAQEKRRR
jgi:hypothetical protein